MIYYFHFSEIKTIVLKTILLNKVKCMIFILTIKIIILILQHEIKIININK